MHYAERWSQDRGSLSPTAERSRFFNPRFPHLPTTIFKPSLRSSSRSPRPEARRTSGALRKGRNRGYTRSRAPHILSVIDCLDYQYQTYTLPCVFIFATEIKHLSAPLTSLSILSLSSKTFHIYTQYGKRPV